MKKKTWRVGSFRGSLRSLTSEELSLFVPMLGSLVDGWLLRVEGQFDPPGAGLGGDNFDAHYTPYALSSGPATEAWVEAWVALRGSNDRVDVLHTIVVLEGESASEVAEWYGLPLRVYSAPERLRQFSYQKLREATYVDAMERFPWFNNTYEVIPPTPDALLAPRPVLRSENEVMIRRLEAMLRTAHPMLRRREPLFDEYCGEIELERVRNVLTADLIHTAVRMRLCARGVYAGEEQPVLLDVETHFEYSIGDTMETPTLFARVVEAALSDISVNEALMEGSRLANNTLDPREAIAQFRTSPLLQASYHLHAPASIVAGTAWRALVEPTPMLVG